VILSGGSGTAPVAAVARAVPEAVAARWSANATMLQDTIRRLDGLPGRPSGHRLQRAHRFLVAEQLRQIDVGARGAPTIVLEPSGATRRRRSRWPRDCAARPADDPCCWCCRPTT
jgi:mannose-1-phosphate guanylyltransferase